MTIHPFGRVTGSLLAVLLAAGVTGGCSEAPTPDSTGTGSDTGTNPTSPLCSDLGKMGAGFGTDGPTPTPGGFPFSPFPPHFGTTVSATVPPPAISGGTLRIVDEGRTAVAADPDRDNVYVVDLTTRSVRATVALQPGDEPGRVVAGPTGRVFVALRHGGAVVTIDTVAGTVIDRRAVCAAPRGLAFDGGLVHVACAGGELVSLPHDGGAAVRTLKLGNDLRDVVVDGNHLRVSRFLSAEVLTVESDGTVSGVVKPGSFRATAARGGQRFTPGVAWRMAEMPDQSGVMMLHQRGVADEVQPVVGGYGGPDACNGIVHPAVTMVSPDGTVRSGPAMAGMVLAVDMAISPDSRRVAIISAGNATNMVPGDDTTPDLARVFVSDVGSTTDNDVGCQPDGKHGPCTGFGTPIFAEMSTGAGGTSGTAPPTGPMTGTAGTGGGSTGCGVPDPTVPPVVGEPIAVAFDAAGTVIVQSREPAMLAFATGPNLPLSPISRADTGHLVFHQNAGGFLACASCHAEGNDDGRVWNFTCQGPRRTQSLHAGGLRGSEPFHWDGEETDMTRLMNDVFVGRMSGPALVPAQIDTLLSWIDKQPHVPRVLPADQAAVERGRALFNDPARGACASCHAGTRFTNNTTVDVGTGRAFQVPSLVGVGTRGPFMHDGCAETLTDRFTNTTCGGGDKHGVTSGMTAGEISDLVTYLQSI